ncbi:MAG: hypothetical protein RIA63_08550, partial [Cyclobacteriaceae bacterium]
MPEFSSIIEKVPATQWREELEKTSSRYHITAAWVAAIFDPVFAVTDYINISNGWTSLLAFRIGVSLVTIATILVR